MYFSLYFIGENMDKDKKIEIEQQELLRLDKENEELNQQIVELDFFQNNSFLGNNCFHPHQQFENNYNTTFNNN